MTGLQSAIGNLTLAQRNVLKFTLALFVALQGLFGTLLKFTTEFSREIRGELDDEFGYILDGTLSLMDLNKLGSQMEEEEVIIMTCILIFLFVCALVFVVVSLIYDIKFGGLAFVLPALGNIGFGLLVYSAMRDEYIQVFNISPLLFITIIYALVYAWFWNFVSQVSPVVSANSSIDFGGIVHSVKTQAASVMNKQSPEVSTCPNCGKALHSKSKFCTGCGQPVSFGTSGCKSCHAPLAPGAQFCPKCGAKTE